MQQPALAAGLAVTVAVLLAARSRLHRFVRSVLTEDELQDALIFAGATLVVLPLVPDRPIGPYGALNPHSIWILVILVMAIQRCGLRRSPPAGARFGLPIAGPHRLQRSLKHGYVPGQWARGLRRRGTFSRLQSRVRRRQLIATIVQMAFVLAATSMTTLRTLSVPLDPAPAWLLSSMDLFGRSALCSRRLKAQRKVAGAFSLSTALVFASTLSSILVASAALREWFGETGIYLVAAALAGFVDTHSAAIVALLVASGTSAADAAFRILAGLSTNTISNRRSLPASAVATFFRSSCDTWIDSCSSCCGLGRHAGDSYLRLN